MSALAVTRFTSQEQVYITQKWLPRVIIPPINTPMSRLKIERLHSTLSLHPQALETQRGVCYTWVSFKYHPRDGNAFLRVQPPPVRSVDGHAPHLGRILRQWTDTFLHTGLAVQVQGDPQLRDTLSASATALCWMYALTSYRMSIPADEPLSLHYEGGHGEKPTAPRSATTNSVRRHCDQIMPFLYLL
ncbi:uncharacterized protein M421DRAFT_306956 [Didymella exigua CBS 183.55]|uniref:Uncharacterized protein n=1 Tax=Didymella exigua CBS 183.55 TaxID=1150837 RepID=A0A6A5R8K3_9PLEO|nr:uncharacterized protein M421DRAFT_306956 [Didymella exigua CBS 183.55]KAF1923649.1 hypothetical protein M421DRAFT_306956 [Didymella exigua CBS 183.55]